jgi:1,2-diacylglycerol 3-alpha-glucosyltransferase
MKIAIFTETYLPFINGVVTHIQTLRAGLIAAGHQVLIVTLDPSAYQAYQSQGILYCPAIPLKKIYGYGIANPLNLQRLHLLQQFDPDIIHLHTEFTMGLFAIFAAKRLKKPIVYTLHTMYDDYLFYVLPSSLPSFDRMAKSVARTYIGKVARQATQIIGPSVKVVEYLRWCGIKKPINIVPNTVNLAAFAPTPIATSLRHQWGLAPQDTALIFVGRLGKEKSIDLLLTYFWQHFAHHSAVKLFLIGDGPEKSSLESQIKKWRAGQQIKLLGKFNPAQMTQVYRASNLFVSTSVSEMNSMALLEATASGLYAIVRKDAHLPQQVALGVTGDTFATSAEFAAHVQHYLSLTPSAKIKIRHQVATAAQCYGQPEFTAATLRVYQRAIDFFSNKR